MKKFPISTFKRSLLKLTAVLLILFNSGIPAQSLVKHPEWSYNEAIYEVNIRQYSNEGTFKAFEKQLPRLKKMGVGILWLMPINPIGEKNRKGSLGSYYSVKDYLAVNPHYGTLDDFKNLVKSIHTQGMHVIVDWVANHTSWDNNLVNTHPDWYTKDSLGNFVPPVADWSDVIDLNYDNQDLRKYMTDALKFWVKDCDIDGYRCDVASMVPKDFWINARKELDKIKPVFLLAESDAPEIHSAFDMTYSWNLLHTMNEIGKGTKNASDIVKLLKDDQAKYPVGAYRMRFTTNHDENSWSGTEFERLDGGAEAFAVLTNLVPGMPLVYTGQEVGLNKRLSFFEKDTINWNLKENKFEKLYSALLNYKLHDKALLNGERGSKINFVSDSTDKNILAFIRKKDGEKILAVFNLSNKNANPVFSNPLIEGKYKNLFTKEKISVSAKQRFELKPWEYIILVQ